MPDDDDLVAIREGMVFPVWHFRAKFAERLDYSFDKKDGQYPRRIGIFSSYDRAVAAVEHYRELPGFRDWPDSFEIFREPLDETAWRDGFVDGWGNEYE